MSQPPEGRIRIPGEGDFCAGDCKHEYCRNIRGLAEQACVYCGQEMGYGGRFYALMCGIAHPICHGYAARVGQAKQ